MNNKKRIEYIITGIAFIIFFTVISYKLTNASLWFDETVEFWYSRHTVGSLPWADGMSNMYERIVSTLQPPLFNILFHFWLKISESEWWMRMFGVVMGMLGAAGVYKTILFGTNSRYKSSFAVVLYAMIYHLTFYWQEVAEYSLMAGLLSWSVYFFSMVINNPCKKQIILFTIFCILPVYSQYGSGFAILAFGSIAFIKIILGKDKNNIKVLLTSYIMAAIFTALPLYFFFVKLQIKDQEAADINSLPAISLLNFWKACITTFKWSFLGRNTGTIEEHILIAVLAIICIIAAGYLFKGRKIWLRYLIAANVICYVAYYFAVSLGFYVYAYGHLFASRYNLFLIPLWFLTGLLLVDAFLTEISEIKSFRDASQVAAFVGGVVIAGLIFWGYSGWTDISSNWTKENIRGVTQTWFEKSGYKENTIVFPYANSGFSYYLMHDKKYKKEMLKKVVFLKETKRNVWETQEDYKKWIDSAYKKWPTSLYIVGSHMSPRKNFPALLKVFTDAGYQSTDIYNKNGARLIYLKLKQPQKRNEKLGKNG